MSQALSSHPRYDNFHFYFWVREYFSHALSSSTSDNVFISLLYYIITPPGPFAELLNLSSLLQAFITTLAAIHHICSAYVSRHTAILEPTAILL